MHANRHIVCTHLYFIFSTLYAQHLLANVRNVRTMNKTEPMLFHTSSHNVLIMTPLYSSYNYYSTTSNDIFLFELHSC